MSKVSQTFHRVLWCQKRLKTKTKLRLFKAVVLTMHYCMVMKPGSLWPSTLSTCRPSSWGACGWFIEWYIGTRWETHNGDLWVASIERWRSWGEGSGGWATWREWRTLISPSVFLWVDLLVARNLWVVREVGMTWCEEWLQKCNILGD